MPGRYGWYWKGGRAVPEHKEIWSYLDTVAAQIRWRRARPAVIAELARHLEDQRDAFVARGCENAAQLAVEEMGDPVAVGLELDRLHRPRPQWSLLALAVLVALVGVVLRIWLSTGFDPTYFVMDPTKTVLAFLLGCGALLAGYFLDYTCLVRHAGKIYGLALALTLLLLLFGPRSTGVAYGARYITLCFPAVYAVWVYGCRGRGTKGLALAIGGIIPLVLLCAAAPHMLALMGLLLSGICVLLLGVQADWFGLGRRKNVVFKGICAVIAVSAALGIWLLRGALLTALYPVREADGIGYVAMGIRKAVESAQWIGKGGWSIGSSYEQTVIGGGSDAFLTTLLYQLGWLPFLAVMMLFAALMILMLRRCRCQHSAFGKAVVWAVVLPLCLQMACSVSWSLGCTLCPASAVLLVGNWNTVLDLLLVGVALSVFREENLPQGAVSGRGAGWPGYRVKVSLEKV